jgi:hypothetical protein
MRRARLMAKWEAYLRQPFPRLVRLSMNRAFRGSQAGKEEDLNLNLGFLLALLALPGGFASILLSDKYGSFLRWLRGQTKFDLLAAALPDEYFFVVLSMVVTGGVAVWWWDSIFPDRRDFANLVHLPIPTARIFFANSSAILLLSLVCAIDVNAASSSLFPLIVAASQPEFSFVARFAAVHALVVVLASAFTFSAVFATAGLLMLLLPFPLFRRVSLYVRTLIAALLGVTLFSSSAVPGMFQHLSWSSHPLLRFLPSAWFLGLWQSLSGGAAQAPPQLGHRALLAVVSSGAVAVAVHALAYRRCFLRLPELPDAPPGHLGTRFSWFFRLLDRLIFRTPFQQAGFRFLLKTSLRSDAHSLALGGILALALVLSAQTQLSAGRVQNISRAPTPDALSIPLILGYCLLIGGRLVLDLPAYLQGNWVFQFLLDKDPREAIPLARGAMLMLVSPWIFLAVLPAGIYFWGWTVGLLHTSLVAVWFVLLTEVLLVGFRKVPFTCTYPPFKPSAVVGVIAGVLGYFAFTALTAGLESEAFRSPKTGAIFLVISLAAWCAVLGIRKSVAETDRQLLFEEVLGAAFECLHLGDGG